MKRYTAIVRFALWGILICAAAVQSNANPTSDHQKDAAGKGTRHPAGLLQRIELMVPGFTADAPYQQLSIITQIGADTTTSTAGPAAEATEESGNVIQQFVEFTGTALGQLMGVGFILLLFWRIFRRIQREEMGGVRGAATPPVAMYRRLHGGLQRNCITVISAKH